MLNITIPKRTNNRKSLPGSPPQTTNRSVRPAAAANASGGRKLPLVGYLYSACGVMAATGCFWLLHRFVDKGQASLLYLPVVIACAIRLGFGPSVLAAILSFLCWDYFFFLPAYTLTVNDPKDWLSLLVFLVAAVTTAQLAAQARTQTEQAQAREAEIATLFEASQALSHEVSAFRLLQVLAQQLQTLCQAPHCLVFRWSAADSVLQVVGGQAAASLIPDAQQKQIQVSAERAFRADPAEITDDPHWPGFFAPLHAAEARIGMLYVGPRGDGKPFSPIDEHLILTLANHAATVLARETLMEQASQAAALRETDSLKDALLSLVSHELRTPLAAIKASSSGLLQPDARWDEESRREALSAIDREADRLTGLVNHLLDLSRLEAGAWNPSKDWCDLPEIIATVLDRLPETAAARVEVEAPANLPLVRVDYIQIALVIQNLIENAVKYVPGDSLIRITADTEDADATISGGSVTVQVRDFGGGVTPGEEKFLFTRFFRGNRYRSGPIHGTGLGLALCEAVLRAHGGHIWAGNASPDEPHGAVFSFCLPIDLEVR